MKKQKPPTVKAKDVRPGHSIRVPGKRKYRDVVVVGEPLSKARGDKMPEMYEGHYLITFDDCGSLAVPPDFTFETDTPWVTQN